MTSRAGHQRSSIDRGLLRRSRPSPSTGAAPRPRCSTATERWFPALLLVLTSLLAAGCEQSPARRAVTGGHLRLALTSEFRELLAERGLHLGWTPPTCSWRLKEPNCATQPAVTTDMPLLTVPIVGGRASTSNEPPRLKARLELAGRLTITGPGPMLVLEDMTVDPGKDELTARTPHGRIRAFFLDSTDARPVGDIEVSRIEVKLDRKLATQIASDFKVLPIDDLVKVGDLSLNIITGERI